MPTATHLSAPDLGIVAFYLVAITLFGLRFAKKGKQEKSLKSYFLADNAIPWWAIALSIVSAETSTLTIISIPGVAFAGNLGFLQIVLGYMLGRIVVALLFLPKYFRGEMLTAYQLIDRRFGPALHKITAGLFLLTRAAAEGVRVFAISIVVSIAIGTGDTLSIAIISALTLLYTFEGGMAAVIWTDVVQMCLYVAGTIVALITLGAHVQGGWPHIVAVAAPLGKFHWLDFTLNLTTTYTFWAGILGGTFLTMASHGTDQLMVQRLLAARNLRESRLALLSSRRRHLPAVHALPADRRRPLRLLLRHAGASFKTNDYIFPTYIVQQMPHGIAGLLVAAILAAAMSNLSAALNSLASTTVIDFYVPFKTRPGSKRMPGSPIHRVFCDEWGLRIHCKHDSHLKSRHHLLGHHPLPHSPILHPARRQGPRSRNRAVHRLRSLRLAPRSLPPRHPNPLRHANRSNHRHDLWLRSQPLSLADAHHRGHRLHLDHACRHPLHPLVGLPRSLHLVRHHRRRRHLRYRQPLLAHLPSPPPSRRRSPPTYLVILRHRRRTRFFPSRRSGPNRLRLHPSLRPHQQRHSRPQTPRRRPPHRPQRQVVFHQPTACAS